VSIFRVQYVMRPSPTRDTRIQGCERGELRVGAPDRARAYLAAWDHFLRQGLDVTVIGGGVRPLDFSAAEYLVVHNAGAKMVFGLPRDGVQIEGLTEEETPVTASGDAPA
jgi:hypothetical protein